jgi:hypothetical protein
MAILNVTYAGLSADVPGGVPDDATDADVRRIATEVIRSGGLGELDRTSITNDTFRHFVVDRFTGSDGRPVVYLRPKVPFGSGT